VPPGRQPAPTSCANAQRDRVQYGANARVIYGDEQAHPGNGRGRHRNREASAASGVFTRSGTTDAATAKRKVIAAQKSSGTAQKPEPKRKKT
jgi:hypothetical protein